MNAHTLGPSPIGETLLRTDSTKNMKNRHHADTRGAEAKSTQNPMIPKIP